MNSSNSNDTFYVFDYLVSRLTGAYIIEALLVYTLLPLSILSLVLNLISLKVLNKKEFVSSPFYGYLRAYALNSSALSLVLTTMPAFIANRSFNFLNEYANIFYGCFIYSPLVSILYLNSSLLEIFIVIERGLYFLPSRFKRFKKVGVKTMCALMLALSFIISLPMFFLSYPEYIAIKLDEDTEKRIYYWGVAPFSLSVFGQIVTILMYIMRDILTLVIKVVLNGASVYLVRNYINKLKMEKLEFALKISSSKLHENKQNGANKKQQDRYISKTDRNQTLLAIIMCVFSLFEHVFYTGSFILYFINSDLLGLFFYLDMLSLALKHFCNFFIFYKFNYLFRTEFKKSLINVCKSSNE